MSRSLLGWVGVFCFTIFLGIVFLAPGVLDAIPFFLSKTGKLTFLSLPLAAVALTTIAGFRHSKWWLVVAGLIVCLLLFIFIRVWTNSGTDGMFRPLEKTGYVPSVPDFVPILSRFSRETSRLSPIFCPGFLLPLVGRFQNERPSASLGRLAV